MSGSGSGSGSGSASGRRHRYWNTQPVMRDGERVTRIGIIHEYSPSEAHTTPTPLIDGFQWSTIDLSDPAQKTELYHFLHANYIANADGKYRYAYSEAFLEWSLNPPGFLPEVVLGVRVKSNGRLVGFFGGVPLTARINDSVFSMGTGYFLTVHQKLRMKNLAPLIIEEARRRTVVSGRQQTIWTSARLITEPITIAGFSQRLINVEKLVAVRFMTLPPEVPIEQLIKKHAIPKGTRLPGFRPMGPQDVAEVTVKLNAHLRKFKIAIVYDEVAAAHWFLPRPGVVASYVVETPTGLDGFFSIFVVNTTTIGVPQYPTMTIGNIFYYFAKPSLLTDLARAAIQAVHWDYGVDVVNCLEIQDNAELRDSLGFTKAKGALHYYLFNYAHPPLRPHEIAVMLP
jgi:glycylpeptide N-tetradecanoyltransferase